ncbi:transketolase [Candidatus Nardonella dryophthoridicola]|uniref:Transketolase n=1 Tax=endosymbiont of Rhynchophorus ferrugineus TaxID=1972133 RepID=A0A2Z5TGN8_9GAMM|nr:transketolase [Candidatus Nardonella dryophthoridicola]BBA85013.1 transketolase [endosymbiont of Rhynchophorus ferrugineus]
MNCSRKRLANAIRILSMDSVEYAKSGHPGSAMGMADVAEVLWRDYINHNPNNPNWFNRDRFILSNGHSSILLYSILHLTGYNLSIEDLKNFRKINSKTPGHPEYGNTSGIEISTGPLGQGLANAVGFAISEKVLSSQFNKPGYNIIDNYTYVFVGDGCLMEGISHEACSIAGNLNLGKLIVFYDKNGISIDGYTKNWFNDNTELRFISYGWNVIDIDGHNSLDIKNAINEARNVLNKPSLIICNTIIGYGSPNKSNKNIIHGNPLGKEEIKLTRDNLNWKIYDEFFIPSDIYKEWNSLEKGNIKESNWNKLFLEYSNKFPELSKELIRRINKSLPYDWEYKNNIFLNEFLKNDLYNNISTREASKNILEKYGKLLPELLGGSADLSSSNLTNWSNLSYIKYNTSGNYIYFGVREFAMTAISNGISIYKGFIPYTSTFLVFSDYAKNAIRMSSIMSIQNIFIYTHDSILLGEDGPTHQPIEHINSLRDVPNLILWRPCNQIETFFAWKNAIENRNKPTVIILSRQKIKNYIDLDININNISKGGYILKENNSKNNDLNISIIFSGSEIEISMAIYNYLISKNINCKIISMPSISIFMNQSKEYRKNIIDNNSKKIIIELCTTNYWYKYVNYNDSIIIGLEDFGKSGSDLDLINIFKFDLNSIINKINLFLKI